MFFVMRKSKIIIAFTVILTVVVAILCQTAGVSSEVKGELLRLPVVMYHSVQKNKMGEYVITKEQFENDLKTIAENGYTTVNTEDIINYVEKGEELPKKCIMLTFDDGHYDNLYYAQPLLEQYGMRASVFIVGEYTDIDTNQSEVNPNYSYLTWQHIAEMSAKGIFEIQNHSYDMHKVKGRRHGAQKAKGESDEEYIVKLTQDLQRLQDAVYDAIGKYPTAFAYPLGAVDKKSIVALKSAGIKVSFNSYKGVSYIEKGNPDSLYYIKRVVRSGKKSGNDTVLELLEKSN